MPNILAFDTATDSISVALMIGDGGATRFFEYSQLAPQKHSELILSILSDLLQQAKIELAQLDAIAFGCGPGSFMGVRIATGVAQGLAFGIDKPLIPISTLQTLAQAALMKDQLDRVYAGWDARMQEIYWGFFQLNSNTGIMEVVGGEKLSPPAEISFSQPKGVAVGNAWEVYRQDLSSEVLDHFLGVKSDWYPNAKAMLIIAKERWNKGEFSLAENAQPVYLRDRVVGSK